MILLAAAVLSLSLGHQAAAQSQGGNPDQRANSPATGLPLERSEVGPQSLRSAAHRIKEGNRLLDEARYEEALAEYDKARDALPQSAEVAYDRGIALYRLGRFAEAEKAFQDALEPGNLELEARSKYNLGRVAQAAAMEKMENLPDAVNDLGRAISFYNDALQIVKDDKDAQLNKEAAERLRAYLEKLLQQQQQEEQKQDGPSSQPDDEPTSQPDEQQPSSQPSEDDQDKQDQEQDGEQDKQGENEKESEKEGQQKDQQQKDKQGQPKDQDTQGDQKKQQMQQNQTGEQKEGMSEEEAEPMLQEARDAERQRREANRMRMLRTRGRIPVSRDW